MERYAIITAGGSGVRMGEELPKQFLDLDGKPILYRTTELFRSLPFDVTVIITMNQAYSRWWIDWCHREQFIFPHYETCGGITRFHSIKNALKYIRPGGIVAVHDAVRPLVSTQQLVRLFALAEQHPAVIPAVEMTESMRERRENGLVPADRTKFFSVQTPQMFRTEVLLDSYDTAYRESFTDDASVVEAKGYPLFFCRGNRFNIKITTKDDLLLARCLFGREIVDPDLSFDSLIK